MAVDAAGTAHVAYNAEYSTGQPLMYCAWPRGARGCVPRAIVADGQSPLAQPPLVQAGPAPGELSIVSARAPIQAFRSLDGGATFAPPAVLGTGSFFDGAFGPEGRLALAIRNLGYINFSQRSLAGPADAGAVGRAQPRLRRRRRGRLRRRPPGARLRRFRPRDRRVVVERDR